MKGALCSPRGVRGQAWGESSSRPSRQGPRDQEGRARTKRGCDSHISPSGGRWAGMDCLEADRGHLCRIKSPGPGQGLCN